MELNLKYLDSGFVIKKYMKESDLIFYWGLKSTNKQYNQYIVFIINFSTYPD